jgi:hypothetical protein
MLAVSLKPWHPHVLILFLNRSPEKEGAFSILPANNCIREGIVVVARSQTFEEPSIQRSGVIRRIDIPIGGAIPLLIISHLC